MTGSILEWLGVSGVVAAIGGLFGYGKLNEKIDGHGAKIAKLENDVPTLIRLDERVGELQKDLAEIKSMLK